MYGLTVELLEHVLAGRRPPRARAGLLGALNEGDRLGWDPARIRRASQRDADARALNRLREAWEEATERARRRVLRWIEREGAKAAGGARQDAAGPAPAGG